MSEEEQLKFRETVDVYENFWSCFSYFKQIFIGLIQLVPKAFIFGVSLVIYIIFLLPMFLCMPNKDKIVDPIRGAYFRTCSRLFARWIMLIMGYYFVRVKGKVYRNSRIIVSNHISTMEIMCTYWLYTPCFVVAEFVMKKFLIKELAYLACAFAVQRIHAPKEGPVRGRSPVRGESGDSSSSLLPENSQTLSSSSQYVIPVPSPSPTYSPNIAPLATNPTPNESSFQAFQHEVNERVNNTLYPPILVFPEGSTSNNSHVAYFHSGIFVCGQPVHPLCTRYHYLFCDPSWSLLNVFRHLCLIISQITNWMTIISLPIYHPSEAEKEHPKYFAWNVRNVIARAGDYDISNVTLKEKLEWERVRANIGACSQIRPRSKKERRRTRAQAMGDRRTSPHWNAHYIPPTALDTDADDFYSNAVLPPDEILNYIESLGNKNSYLIEPPASFHTFSPYPSPTH